MPKANAGIGGACGLVTRRLTLNSFTGHITAYLPSTACSLALILFTYASLAAGKLAASMALDALTVGTPVSFAKACSGEITSYEILEYRRQNHGERVRRGSEGRLVRHRDKIRAM